MATIFSPSSASPHDDIPTATLALPTPSSSRRLPPPCWSPEETFALIHAYRDKWYSLRRGNLRANHWQEVADDVASRCPVNPSKTAVQCRHKMEKLRKRYRSEIQRAAAHGGVRRFSSSWAHFQIMHSMEKGPESNRTPPSSSDDEEIEENRGNFYNNSSKRGVFVNQGGLGNGAATGVRIKIPGQDAAARVYSAPNPNYPNPRFGANSFGNSVYGASSSSKVFRDGFVGRGDTGKNVNEVSKKKNVDSEVVGAIQALGEGFMRIEKAKMDMARQIEEMHMEMELKRTEMILESQQRIVEAFANAISETSNKKAKRMSNSP
ncbi:hypothetical protein ACJIZ3_016506 [Penstemon smallii]|uniref:Myb-like domain-containing protein n=1 Tax=Penstemon smallii TaxID=265156 RepID=A0ABD3RQT7_9LAMI